MKKHVDPQAFTTEAQLDDYLKNVPQEVWAIFDAIVRALHQTDALAFEAELAEIEAAIRGEALRKRLEKGSEPFWMQDIRLAQHRIDAARVASRSGPANQSGSPSE